MLAGVEKWKNDPYRKRCGKVDFEIQCKNRMRDGGNK